MKKIYALMALLLCNLAVMAQISIISTGVAYVQDFNTLASSGTSSTLPTGWAFVETGAGANTTYTADNGSNTNGDTYSYGTTSSTDRAFGTLQQGSFVSTIGASFINNTSSVIFGFSITYTGEQWRSAGGTDRLDFQYSTNATSLTTGTWTDVNTLDFVSPNTSGAGAIDGNTNFTIITTTILGLNIANGSTFWIRWTDFNVSGLDDGLAVDNFSLIVPPGIPTAVNFLNFSGYRQGTSNILRWTTASESDNTGFEVQRSGDGISFTAIGFVNTLAAGGNSQSELSYTFTDNNSMSRQFYRLREIDIAGHSRYSSTVLIKGEKPNILTIGTVYPNPARSLLNITIDAPGKNNISIVISDLSGKILDKRSSGVETGSNTMTLDVSRLGAGTYMIKLVCDEGCGAVSRFVKQ